MGTFKLRATSVESKTSSEGNWATDTGSQVNADLVAAIFDPSVLNWIGVSTAATGDDITGRIRFNVKFYLDGAGVPTEINSLPVGFTLLTAAVADVISFFGTGAGLARYLQFDPSRESGDKGITLASLYLYPSSMPSPAGLYVGGMGVRFTGEKHTGNIWYEFRSLEISGTYNILSLTYTLDTIGPVSAGDEIEITSVLADPLHLKLNHVDVEISYTNYTNDDGTPSSTPVSHTLDITVYILQIEITIQFTLPVVAGGYGSVIYVDAVGDGTQFSGSITLGSLAMLIVDSSGIYRLVTAKTSDTIYTDAPVNDDTTDVKIPNPFAKIGYIGG